MPLPAGLTLDPATGVISGVPSQSGIFSVKLRVTDAIGARAETTTSISVVNYTPMSFSNDIGRVQRDVAYSESVGRSGGTPSYTYAVITGALPDGLSLNAATGLITGTPTVDGLFTATVRCTDFIGQTATCDLVFLVADYPSVVVTAPDGSIGVGYVAGVSITGGVDPYVLTVPVGSIPPGTSFALGGFGPGDWQLQGTCYTPGTYTFVVRVTDDDGNFADSDEQVVVFT